MVHDPFMLPEPDWYLEILQPYPPEVVALARSARLRLLACLPPCVEVIWDATNAVTSGYGRSERTADQWLHLPVYAKWVNLGFNLGALMDDPEGRLVGVGNQVRHIRLQSADDIDDPYVQDLIRQAVSLRPPEGPITPRQAFREMNGPRRRPKPSG
jgi:hypothetical protein